MGQIKRLSFLLLLFLGLGSCSRHTSSRQDVLILLFENDAFEESLCGESPKSLPRTGLDFFCKNAVSIESLSASSASSLNSLISFLFQKSPKELHLANSQEPVSASFESTAEVAAQLGYVTGFFSSSPVFSRRTGLDQGFSVFQESHSIAENWWGTAQERLFDDYLHWRSEVGGPTYTVLTFSDLLFSWKKNTPSSGQSQPATLEAQLEKFNDNLVGFFQQLKKSGRLDNSWILLAGLAPSADKISSQKLTLLVHSPEKRASPDLFLPNLKLSSLSKIFHQYVFFGSPRARVELSDNLNPIDVPEIKKDWLESTGGPFRAKQLLSEIAKDQLLLPWLLLEFLEGNRISEFNKWAPPERNLDVLAFWERVQNNKKTLILQDPCLRTLDLTILENASARQCHSAFLGHLISWMRLKANRPEEAALKEVKLRTLHRYHELKSLVRIFRLNRALNTPLDLDPEIGWEVLRGEMALRLPNLAAIRSWLETNESTLSDSSDSR